MVTLEHYEVGDLAPWLAEQDINHELLYATDNNQNAVFPEFHRIVRDMRFHMPANCTGLADEMTTFVYKQRSQPGQYGFGASGKLHDDRVYSAAWSIFSLRNEVMDLYKLDYLACEEVRAYRRALCFLMGGDQLLHCSEGCNAFHQIKEMFQEFKGYHQLNSELDIASFFKAYVRSDQAITVHQGVKYVGRTTKGSFYRRNNIIPLSQMRYSIG
jgi:hypothetical protein